MKINNRLIVLATILLLLPVVIGAPNPGHDAPSIGAGTFASGDFVFQNNLTITGNASAAYVCISGDCRNSWPTGNVTESNGAANYVAKFTSGTNIGTGLIYDNGSHIGIGTTSPESLLQLEYNEASGLPRVALKLNNTNTGTGSFSGIGLSAGGKSNHTYLMHHSSTYTLAAGYKNYGLLTSTGSGLIIRAQNAAGDISFLTGGEVLGTNTRMFIDSNGRIGIGTTSPQTQLQIAGTGDSISLNVSDDLFVNDTTGYVGIGTYDPQQPLEIYEQDNSKAAGIRLNSDSVDWALNAVGSGVAGRANNFEIWQVGTGAALSIDSNRDVGIGTTNPLATLEIAGSGSGLSLNASDDLFVDDSTGYVGIGQQSPSGRLHVSTAAETNSFVINDTTGFVGINTTAPSAPLSFGQSMAGQTLLLFEFDGTYHYRHGFGTDITDSWETNMFGATNGTAGHLSFGFIDIADGTTFLEKIRVDTSGTVGVGTKSAAATLHVNGSQSTLIRVDADDTEVFNVSDNGSIETQAELIAPEICLNGDCRTAWPSAGGGGLWTNSSGNATYTSGRVGIGTDTPASTLHVNGSDTNLFMITNTTENVFIVTKNGTVYADGGYGTPAADLAEAFTIIGEASPGDVVVIDKYHDETMRRSDLPYDTMVAGVVSTKPGVRLGEEGMYIALAGRVPVKVIGEVQRGDLLVTSSEPGRAMACERRDRCAGAILAKALTNASDGQVIALITLQ